jgi:hypothetical protein
MGLAGKDGAEGSRSTALEQGHPRPSLYGKRIRSTLRVHFSVRNLQKIFKLGEGTAKECGYLKPLSRLEVTEFLARGYI